MLNKKIISIFFLISLLFNIPNLKAETKKNIIENINQTDSIKFDFVQITNSKEELGICYLKRPFYLKCQYKDKNQKELIVNKRTLIIYHKRYEKIYNYPLSKTYFTEILSKEKFIELIKNGVLAKKGSIIIIKCKLEGKGEIDFYFNGKNFSLNGWDLNSLNENKISLKIFNSVKNPEIKKSFFDIPKIN